MQSLTLSMNPFNPDSDRYAVLKKVWMLVCVIHRCIINSTLCTLHPFADVAAQCLQRLTSNEIQLRRNENVLLFEVKTCSRIKVQLRNAHIHMAYELNFASNPNEDNIVSGVAIKKTTRKTSPFTQDCSKKRQFWVKWANNVISGGVGLIPGTKEVMRLEDKGERYGKIVTLANVLTEPNDENAAFTIYPGI